MLEKAYAASSLPMNDDNNRQMAAEQGAIEEAREMLHQQLSNVVQMTDTTVREGLALKAECQAILAYI